jgi:hypothetical protein
MILWRLSALVWKQSTRRAIALMFCLLSFFIGQAKADDVVKESVITASLPERSISALVTELAGHDTLKRSIILMPGSPGIMKIESPETFALKGNFLIRTRKYWLDRETVVFSVDAPTDEWRGFTGRFRAGTRYAEDIRGLFQEIEKKYGKLPLVIVGTSEGSVSAYFVAKALSSENIKVIFTSSLFNSSNNSFGLASLDFDDFNAPMLWVHHANDGCRFTPFWQARRHAEKTGAPLITVNASDTGRGGPCEAFSQHGYAGAEEQTVRAMKNWVVNGIATDVIMP